MRARRTPPPPRRLLVCQALVGLVLAAVPAAGAGPGAAEGEARPPVRVQMDEVEIKGEVERPEVFYIIPRRPVRLDLGPLTKDYREEILTPLDPRAFAAWVNGR